MPQSFSNLHLRDACVWNNFLPEWKQWSAASNYDCHCCCTLAIYAYYVYLYILHNTSSMVLAKWFSIFVTTAFIGILCSKRFQSNRTLEGCSVQSWDDSQHKIKLLRWLCEFISKLFDNLHSNSETLVVYMHIHLCYKTTLNAIHTSFNLEVIWSITYFNKKFWEMMIMNG